MRFEYSNNGITVRNGGRDYTLISIHNRKCRGRFGSAEGGTCWLEFRFTNEDGIGDAEVNIFHPDIDWPTLVRSLPDEDKERIIEALVTPDRCPHGRVEMVCVDCYAESDEGVAALGGDCDG